MRPSAFGPGRGVRASLKISAFIMVLALCAGASAVAVAGGLNRASLSSPGDAPPDRTVAAAFPTFGEPPSLPDDVSTIADLKTQFAGMPASSPIADADFSLARAVPIAGAGAKAWIAPSGEHVCTFIPDPVDGYGATCVTLADIDQGHGFAILGGRSRAYVVALLPNGDSAPKVTSKSDPDAEMRVTGNASAGVLPTDAVITSDHARIDVASSAGPTDQPTP